MPPGSPFPSERDLQQAYGLSRDTVRLAAATLRAEGLIVVRHGQASRVRQIHDKQPIDLTGVTSVDIRMPTPAERDQLGVDQGIPVWVITRAGGTTLLPGDKWTIHPQRSN